MMFGRRRQFDERSRKFGIVATIADPTPRSYTWACPTWLDQGQEGACTGFALAHNRIARPRAIPADAWEAQAVYKAAQKIDPWEGEDYEGTSVLAAVKAAQSRGWLRTYRWAFGERELAVAVSRAGPAILGINWHTGMRTPSAEGLVRAVGPVLGGHAILCTGYNVRTRRYRLHNSWGAGWGHAGDCFLSADDMAALLAAGGEACLVVE